MSNDTKLLPMAAALGVTFAVSISASPLVNAAENPFAMTDLGHSAYMLVGNDAEGKCGEGKCGGEKKEAEGKCGEGKCGGEKKEAEGKCGEGKCGGTG